MEKSLISHNSSRILLNNIKDQTKKEAQERKRNILHLIFNYLIDHNLNGTAQVLQNEAQIGPQYNVCDNVDLDIILQEYQSYYYTKFQKYPKILRKLDEATIKLQNNKKTCGKSKSKRITQSAGDKLSTQEENTDDFFPFEIVSLNKDNKQNEFEETYNEQDLLNTQQFYEYKNYSKENREIASQIIKEFIPKNLNITWNDCIGLNAASELLKEAIIYPTIYPELFKNVSTWTGILLYGPPGTGKTLLAKALACEKSGIFINVSSAIFISKWRGESEKMLKILFDIAKFYSPTTIFIDEIDSLISTTNDTNNHEASKRFKSELLTQIDGITKLDEQIFILATTNSPWNIDTALLRRFEKRIFIPLPNEMTRKNILCHYLNKNTHNFNNNNNNTEMSNIIDLTLNFSGSDLKTVAKEVEMILIREKLSNIKDNHNQSNNKTRKATTDDLIKAINKIKPCIDIGVYKKYYDWSSKHGSI